LGRQEKKFEKEKIFKGEGGDKGGLGVLFTLLTKFCKQIKICLRDKN